VKRSREACTDLFWVLYGFSGENADPALWRYCFRGALKRGSAVYLLLYGVLKRDSRFGFFGLRSQLRGASVVFQSV
jgi:hypothetical protein